MHQSTVKTKWGFILAILICLLPLNIFAQEQIIRIGALANRGYDECLKKWEPTAIYLTKKVPPYTFRIVPLSFNEIKQAIQNERVEFVICNPGIYVEIEALYGASRIATINNKVLGGYYSLYGGVIFTREDNRTIHVLSDLKGKRFSAVDPDSFGGWLAAWRELNRIGIDPARDFTSLTYTGQQDKVVYDVLSGKADAGTIRTDILEGMIKAGTIRLGDIRILAAEGIDIAHNKMEFPFLLSTRLYPEWPIAKLMKTPNELATKIAVALMSMDRYDPAAVAAESGGWTYPMNYQIVHDLMMELKIGYYGKLRQLTLTDLLKKYWLETLATLFIFLITSGALLLVLRLNRRLATIKKELDSELAARKKIQAEIQRSEEQHRLLIEMLPLAVFVHTHGKIVYVNPAFLTLFKASSPDDVIGMRLSEFTPPELFDTIEERRRIMTEEKLTLPPLELDIRCMDGTVITVVSTPMSIIFQDQPAILTALYDITERKQSEEKINHLATHDMLTDLPSLRLAKDRLSMAMNLARRHNTSVAVLFIDLDGFKSVNDNLGHDAGDYVLKQVAQRMLSCVRETDTVARVGGDEFLLILTGIHLPETAAQIAEKVIRLVSQPISFNGRQAIVGTSIGIAIYPINGEDMDQLIKQADEAMYSVKNAGKNGFRFINNAK